MYVQRYSTAHFGKWHSGQADGYYPWNRGFDISYMSQLYTYYNNEVLMNGHKMQTWGWIEEWLADRINDYISEKLAKNENFFILWTPMSIHKGRVNFWESYEDFVAPSSFIQQYSDQVPYDLAKVYAMVSFFDYCLGKVLSNLKALDATKDTAIFFFSDNGPLLYGTDHAYGGMRKLRVPSEMQQEKGYLEENGVRSFMFVSQPGRFPKGGVIEENIDVTDILPTILELSNKKNSVKKQFDGFSFAELLYKPDSKWAHHNRTIYIQEVLKNSIGTNELLELDSATRNVKKGQSLLKFYGGGRYGKGFGGFSAVKWKNYKYSRGKLINIAEGKHKENFEYRVQDQQVYDFLSQNLKDWWKSVLDEPGSFEKPIFFIGYENSWETHVPLKAPIEASPGSAFVGDHAIQGFYKVGDYVNYRVKVVKSGAYDVKLIYSWGGYKGAVINISIGSYEDIQTGKAASVQHKINYNGNMDMGTIQLEETPGNKVHEMQILLLSREENDGGKVFEWLSEIRFYRIG
eukprot:TRINITY_DN2996_c0_g1_i1.p1 TRINITY_DN2996_c0_g1~~TRINITY_DN2996_c0_g1_i1.p1  ORF type:complete len:517 (-),score=52.16 TRINITY_DN2996_c0_g1_i1:402-1952(-)